MARRAASTASTARKAPAKTVEVWVAEKEFDWKKRHYDVGDELTLDELHPGLEPNELLTQFFNAPTFTYEIQHGLMVENGRQVPNMETKNVKFPIARK